MANWSRAKRRPDKNARLPHTGILTLLGQGNRRGRMLGALDSFLFIVGLALAVFFRHLYKLLGLLYYHTAPDLSRTV